MWWYCAAVERDLCVYDSRKSALVCVDRDNRQPGWTGNFRPEGKGKRGDMGRTDRPADLYTGDVFAECSAVYPGISVSECAGQHWCCCITKRSEGQYKEGWNLYCSGLSLRCGTAAVGDDRTAAYEGGIGNIYALCEKVDWKQIDKILPNGHIQEQFAQYWEIREKKAGVDFDYDTPQLAIIGRDEFWSDRVAYEDLPWDYIRDNMSVFFEEDDVTGYILDAGLLK